MKRVLFLIWVSVLLAPWDVRGAEEKIPDDKCLECHGDKDLTKDMPDGKKVSVFADAKMIGASSHGKVACADCHKGIGEEHPDDKKVVKAVDCASCHEKQSKSFGASVHGLALKKGSDAAANCKDCHGTHGVLPQTNAGSMIHITNLAKTCGVCHAGQAADVIQSVHGKALAKGERDAPGCIDCHSEHKIRSLAGTGSSRAVESACGRCHESERINTKFGLPADRVKTFFESYHGLAVQGGSARAANCASCHGYHKILPSSDPASSINRSHLVQTCGKCHPGATENFAFGEVHRNDSAEGGTGAVVNHWVRLLYILLIIAVIGGMLLHNFMSWMRALRALYHGRGETIVRMNMHQRMQHFVLVACFVMLALSGFALKYPDSWLAWMFGSDEAVRRWLHRAAGVMMLAGGLWHVIYALGTKDGRRLVKDMMPRLRDPKDMWANLLYFVGKRPTRPSFARFGYPEKLEYWAVIWGTVIMGVTGLMIWLKIDVTQLCPRWVVEVAITVHYYEAILACSAIVVWHFYHVLFAPGIYPMNFAWWDGRVPKSWHDEEHRLEEIAEKKEDGDEK